MTAGSIQRDLGHAEDALELLTLAFWDLVDAKDIETAYLTALNLSQIEALGFKRHDAAERWLSEAETLLRLGALGVRREFDLKSFRGTLAISQGENERAKAFFRSALDLELEDDASSARGRAHAWATLAAAHTELGEIAEAIEASRQALELSQRAYGENHPQTAKRKTILALNLFNASRGAEALELVESAIATLEAAEGSGFSLQHSLGVLAAIYGQLGRHEEGLAAYERGLELTARISGENHPTYAMLLDDSCDALMSLGRLDEARARKHRALELISTAYGADGSRYAVALQGLASIAIAQGRYEEARSAAERSSAINEREDHRVNLANDALILTRVALAQSRWQEARTHSERAVSLRKELGMGELGVAGARAWRGLATAMATTSSERRPAIDELTADLETLSSLGDAEGVAEQIRSTANALGLRLPL